MYALDENLGMKVEAATFLAFDGSIDRIDSAKNATLGRRVAPERILATLTGYIAVWAFGAKPNSKQFTKR